MFPVEKQAAGRSAIVGQGLKVVGRGLKEFLTEYAGPLAVGGYTQYKLTQPKTTFSGMDPAEAGSAFAGAGAAPLAAYDAARTKTVTPGMDPLAAAFLSVGTGSLAAPKDWRHVWRSRIAKPELSKTTNMISTAWPLLQKKIMFAAGGAGSEMVRQVIPVISNLSESTANVNKLTGNLAAGSAEVPNVAKQVASDITASSRELPNIAGTVSGSVQATVPQIAGNLLNASRNVSGTSAGLNAVVDQVGQAASSVNDIANLAKDPAIQSATGKAVKTQTDFMDSASKLMDGARKYAPAVGAGALGLGGGYLALQWLKNRSEENRKERTMQAMFPARLKAAASVDIKIRKPVSRVIRSGGPGSSKWQTGHSYQGAQTKAAHASVLQSIVDAISDSTADTGRSFGSDVRTMRTALPIAGSAAGMGSGLMLGSSLGAMLGAHRGNTVAGVGRGAIRGAGIGAGAGAGLGLGAAVLSKLQDSGVDIKEPLMLAGIPLAGAVAGGSLGHSLTDSMLGNPKDENTPEASPMSRGLVTGAAGAVPGFLLGGPTGAAIVGLGSGALGYMAQRNRQQEYNHKVAAAHDCGAALASLTNRTKTVTRQEASAVGPNMVTKLREMSA